MQFFTLLTLSASVFSVQAAGAYTPYSNIIDPAAIAPLAASSIVAIVATPFPIPTTTTTMTVVATGFALTCPGQDLVNGVCVPCCPNQAPRNAYGICCKPTQILENGKCCDPAVAPIAIAAVATTTSMYQQPTGIVAPTVLPSSAVAAAQNGYSYQNQAKSGAVELMAGLGLVGSLIALTL